MAASSIPPTTPPSSPPTSAIRGTEATSSTLASAPTCRALELSSLLEVVAELAATDLGRERVLASLPLPAAELFELHRRRYEEAELLVAERRLVAGFDFPLGTLLEDLGSGRPGVAGQALVQLRDALSASEEARSRLLAPRSRDATGGEPTAGEGSHARVAPALAGLAEPLPDTLPLIRKIDQILDRRGQVKEDASPKLSALRGRIRTVRDSLYTQLKGIVEAEKDNLSEETIPMRGGRLVLMLSSGSRGRIPGLTHGRSATGRSFYFEPLSAVEANNDLQQAVEDEEAEKSRLLAELLGEARRQITGIRAHTDLLAELDRLQAAVRFAQLTAGRLAELAPRGELRLVGARHPLLDPRLAELRRQALGQSGHEAEIVPLDLELSGQSRALVVTGPNAGGKTVVLKTLGLLALFHQCGYPLPVASGTALPFLEKLVATVGDEQDLLADRSTFSGRLLRLREAWEAAGPDSLVLLDELGSGTDPEEGAALAISLLEGLVASDTLCLITTHLTPLAAAALEMPGAACAAMQFDSQTGGPTFRLLPGPPGGSEALALAHRLGLPTEWLERAERKLGSEHRNFRRLLAEVETLRGELERQRDEANRRQSELELAQARLERAREALEEERKNLGKQLRAEVQGFRTEVRRKLSREVERLREEVKKGRRKSVAKEAEERLFEAAPDLPAAEEPGDEHPLVVGERVRHRGLGWEGTLDKLSGDRAEVTVRGKRVRCHARELAGLGSAPKPKARARVSLGRGTADAAPDHPSELNLIGQRVEPALEQLDGFLDQALLRPGGEVRIIHGHGTGRLRDAVREHLRGHPAVATYRPGAPNEGGNGATVVAVRAG